MFSRQQIKRNILVLLRCLGGFSLSKKITSNSLRILCYHGVSSSDEHIFNPLLFMRSATFRKRMAFLEENNFNVIPLETAINSLQKGTLPPNSVVITIDDGWYYTHSETLPILEEYKYPSTIYVTSYYSSANTSVLNVVLRYLIWKCQAEALDLSPLGMAFHSTFDLKDRGQKENLLQKILYHIESCSTLTERKEAVATFADMLGFDGNGLLENCVFHLMTAEQIKTAKNYGADIQLHTHRHRFPAKDRSALKDEILKNRESLEPLVGKKLTHLCYPSGEYYQGCFNTLHELSITTATTCEPGFVHKKTNPLALPRFLDGENISQLEFEAEVSGVLELLRRVRSLFGRDST